LLEGHFVLSSGLHSSKYIQCAKLLSFPSKAESICKSLASKIKKKFKKIDLILAPAMGGIIIGYEIGRILKIQTIFCERINGKFTLRRGFSIKKNSSVLIIEDVITTGKSSMECVKLIKRAGKLEKKDKKDKAVKLYKEAFNKLETANKKDKNNPDILNYMGFTSRKSGNFNEAEKFYLKGLSLDPKHNGINEYLGELYVQTNRIEKAKERLAVLKNCGCKEFQELELIIKTRGSKIY